MRGLAFPPFLAFTLLASACGDDASSSTPVCTPGEAAPCFSGDPAAIGVGTCKTGVRICAEDGLSLGACQGEVGPQPETCTTPVDDDCDGEVNESGEGCQCEIGETLACYTGLADTRDIGACASGTQACLGSDEGFGACTGEIHPSDEACGTTLDESCDGSPFDGCPGEVVAATFIPEGAAIKGLLAHPDGGVIAVGSLTETVDLGSGPLVNQGGDDGFVARFDDDGAHLWSRAFGGPGNQGFLSVLFTPSGGLLVNATQSTPADYGGGLATGPGSGQAVLLELDDTGAYVGLEVFGAATYGSGAAAAFFPNGDRLVSFAFMGEMVVGGQTLSPPADYGAVTGRMSSTGEWIWFKSVFSDLPIYSVASPHSAGGAVVDVLFEGTVVLDGTPYTSLGGLDSLLVRVDDDGQILWTKPIAGPDSTGIRGIAPDPNGETSFFVAFEDSVDLGGGPLTQRFENFDIAFARVDGAGDHLWSKQLGSTVPAAGAFIAITSTVLPDGGLVANFTTANATLDLGGGEIGTLDSDFVVASLGPDGLPDWYRHALSTATIHGPSPLAVDPVGSTWLFVGHHAPLDLGSGPIPHGHHLLKLSP